jgi:hypothetical protein
MGLALQGKHTAEASELYMAFELGEKNWKLALGDGACGPSRYTVAAGDTAALLECFAKAKARCGLALEASVGSCYEAGATASGCTAGSSRTVCVPTYSGNHRFPSGGRCHCPESQAAMYRLQAITYRLAAVRANHTVRTTPSTRAPEIASLLCIRLRAQSANM